MAERISLLPVVVRTLEELRTSLSLPEPPAELSPLLRALWHAGRGDWDAAHGIAQEIETRDGAWVHAYLHRKEGDAGNAAYWYRHASRPICNADLDDEWSDIARSLLRA